MQPITIKDSNNADTVFSVVRQPGANISAVLYAHAKGPTRVEQPKIEVSSRLTNGKAEPVVSLVVPYGATVNGIFQKAGQVSITLKETQQNNAPSKSIADAVAWATNLVADPQIKDLMTAGTVS